MTRLLPILLLLTACSPEKRLQRLVDKNPHLRDTVVVHLVDTVIVPADTIHLSTILRDTVRVESERQVVQVVRIPTGHPCDTVEVPIEVWGEVRADTVIVTNTVEVERIVCPPDRRVASWWRTVALVLAAIVALGVWARMR